MKSVSAEAALAGTVRNAKSVALQNGMAYEVLKATYSSVELPGLMCSEHLHFVRLAAWRGQAARIQVCPGQQGIAESTIGRGVCPGHMTCTSLPSLPGEVLQDTLDGSLRLGADSDARLVHLDSTVGRLLGLAAGPLPLLRICRLLLDPIQSDTLIIAVEDPLEGIHPVCPVPLFSLEEFRFIAACLGAAMLRLQEIMGFKMKQDTG